MKFFPLQNRLTEHITGWKIWYFVFLFLVLMISSVAIAALGTVLPLKNLGAPIQMLLMPLVGFALVWLFSSKKPTKRDLGLDKGVNSRALIIILAVFAVTHLIFYLLAKMSGMSSDTVELFREYGFRDGFWGSFWAVISTVILAPVCEEILYRGLMLRTVHDGLAGKFPENKALWSLPVIVSVIAVAVAFILPHVEDLRFDVMSLAYFVTSAGFSLVYIFTRSLSAAMVSHSLQSCFAFFPILLYGRGDTEVHPIIYIIAFTCPLIVYFIGFLLRKI